MKLMSFHFFRFICIVKLHTVHLLIRIAVILYSTEVIFPCMMFITCFLVPCVADAVDTDICLNRNNTQVPDFCDDTNSTWVLTCCDFCGYPYGIDLSAFKDL